MALTGLSRLAPIPLRLAAGAIFIYHGYGKIFGKDIREFVEFVRTFDLPYPEIAAQVAAWGELAGGVLLVLGFATRLAALVNAGTMFVALWKVHLKPPYPDAFENLPEYEFPLAMFAICLALVFAGAGALSFDSMLSRRHTVVETTSD